MEALRHLDKARTQTISLKEFLTQWEALTNNQLTGVDDTLKEIDEQISQAYVLAASLYNQINELGEFLMAEYPEAIQGEAAIGVAIKLLKERK